MKTLIILIMLSFGGLLTSLAQKVEGYVFDAKYDRPLEHVHVYLENTQSGATTDERGFFLISSKLQGGEYILRASLIGYHNDKQTITLTESEKVEVTIYLQPSVIRLTEEIVVTAKRIETACFSSPEAITIIDQQNIERENSRSLPELFGGIAGVFMQKTNHGGGSPFIRGLTGNQNLILVDGVRLNNTTFRYGPNQYLGTIDPFLVQRVEVVRGAGSVMYGSDAIGGVLNAITLNPAYSKQGVDASISISGKWMSGSMEKTGNTRINIATKKIALTAGFTYQDFGDIIAGKGIGKQQHSGYTMYSADGKLMTRVGRNHELVTAFQYARQDDVPRTDRLQAGFSRYHFDPQIRLLAYARLKSLYKNKWFRQISFTPSFGQSKEVRNIQKSGQSKITDEQDEVLTTSTSIEICSQPSEKWSINSGIDYYFDKVFSSKTETDNGSEVAKRGYYPDGATSLNFAVYSTHTLKYRKFGFQAGGRFNAYKLDIKDNEFGDVTLNPDALIGGLSVIYHLNSAYNFILSANTAFRAPNINDLSSFGLFAYGIEVPNANLKPEKSQTLEFGIKNRYEKFSGSFFLFDTKLYNLIDRISTSYNGQDSLNGFKVYQKKNFSRSRICGIEAEGQYILLSWFTLTGNLSYTYGKNLTVNEPMSRIPPLNGYLGLLISSKKGFWGRIEWQSADAQTRLSSNDKNDTRIPTGGTPGWNILNIRLGYTWQSLTFSAGFNNLFNEAYRTHGSGVDGYGRSMWLSLRFSSNIFSESK